MTSGIADLEPVAAQLLAQLRPAGAPEIHAMPLARARAFAAALPSIVGPGPATATTDLHAGGAVPVRVYEGAADAAPVTLVHIHGGGWVLGGIDNDDALVRHLAQGIGGRAVSVGYRLAPEHRFPAALEDVLAVVDWAAARWPDPVVLVGESAGGNLAAAAALERREVVAGQVLVCPLLDHAATPSYADAGVPGLVCAADLAYFWDQYVPDPAARDDPRAAPLRAADLDGAPAAVVITVGHDPLRDEGLAYAERLRAAGIPVRHEHRPDLMHGFLPLAGLLPAALEVAALISREAGRLGALEPADV